MVVADLDVEYDFFIFFFDVFFFVCIFYLLLYEFIIIQKFLLYNLIFYLFYFHYLIELFRSLIIIASLPKLYQTTLVIFNIIVTWIPSLIQKPAYN